MHQHVIDRETRRFGQLIHGACAVATILLVMAASSFLYNPMVEGSSDLRGQIADVKAKLRLAPAVRKEHSELRERLDDVTQRMQRLRTCVPEDDHISHFISQITDAAEKDGIVITDFDAQERVQKAGYSEREITFTGTGKYAGICRFVSRVETLPRLTKVTGLTVQTESVGQETYPMTLRVLIYFGLTVDSDTESETLSANGESQFREGGSR